ncbi:hypothetical protein JXD38_10720 [candidate division WOR-3 bacterium]|nr:hypothetical protein [candidate division WOR-3 bacterium]
MTQTAASTEKLDEALAHLNEAAKERREELNKLLTEKYTDLKSALGGAVGASAGWVKEQGKEVGDTAKLAASSVDRSAHMHPWYYVGGAAVGALILGFLLGRHR